MSYPPPPDPQQQPWSGQPYGPGQPYQPGQPTPPGQPYQPGQPYAQGPAYNPNQPFPSGPVYDPNQPYAQPGGPPPLPPKKSNVPLIAVIVAVALLLCGGAVTAGVLLVRKATDQAKEALEPITNPSLPAFPTDLPKFPTDLPEVPGIPTELPTNIPNLPGNGTKLTVKYEVTGDGPIDISYTSEVGSAPVEVKNAKLPWTKTVTMESPTVASVTVIRNTTKGGSVGCRTTINGAEVAKKSGEGGYATVLCLKLVLQ